MREVKRQVNTPRFVPDYMAESIEAIDFKRLKAKGIKYIAFDADSTLVPYRGIVLSEKTKKYLLEHKKLFKKWCIASNRPTNDLQELARSIDARVIRAVILKRKPTKRYFKKVLKYFGAKPSEVAMIGDKLVADMFGAKRMGMVTVWVERLGRDGLLDRITHLRRWEKKIIKRYL